MPSGEPIISVSAAPYDGYAVPALLDSLARCGVSHVEPAYIVGYTEPFDENAFTPARAADYRAALEASGLRCHAFSAHVDLGLPGMVDIFRRRMDFARTLGARVINTNAARRDHEASFFNAIGHLARHGEAIGLRIGLENPGNGEDNLINAAEDGIALVQHLAHPQVGLNYDAGNLVSHRPGLFDPAADAILALEACVHTHIKDVRRTDQGWFFVTPGTGDIDCAAILRAMRAQQPLDFSIEIPLRIHRGPDALPLRDPEPVPLPVVEETIRQALHFVREQLGPGHGSG